MQRGPRLFIPGAICHVYCRVARGEFIARARRVRASRGVVERPFSRETLIEKARADQTRGRIEFCTFAVGRCGLRVCNIFSLSRIHPNSVTKWLYRGLRLESDDPEFKDRLKQLDAAISRRG